MWPRVAGKFDRRSPESEIGRGRENFDGSGSSSCEEGNITVVIFTFFFTPYKCIFFLFFSKTSICNFFSKRQEIKCIYQIMKCENHYPYRFYDKPRKLEELFAFNALSITSRDWFRFGMKFSKTDSVWGNYFQDRSWSELSLIRDGIGAVGNFGPLD